MHCKAGKKQQICNRRFGAKTPFRAQRWGYMYYSIFACAAVPAFSNARGLYPGTVYATETCLWQRGSKPGSNQPCKMARLLCDSTTSKCYRTRSLSRDVAPVSSNGRATAVYDWKLRYHSHAHVNKAQQDAMWLIERVRLCGFWGTSDTKDGRYSYPSTLGRMLFVCRHLSRRRLEGRDLH